MRRHSDVSMQILQILSRRVASSSSTQLSTRVLTSRTGVSHSRAWHSGLHVCAAQSSGGIDPPNVRKLAKLAQIEVTDEEVADWEPKLKEIVTWFDQLQSIDVEGIPPSTRLTEGDLSVAGKDEPREYADREGLLQGVPDREGPFVKVPKIL